MLLFVYQEDVSKSSLKTTCSVVSKLPVTSPFEINDINSLKLLYIHIYIFFFFASPTDQYCTANSMHGGL